MFLPTAILIAFFVLIATSPVISLSNDTVIIHAVLSLYKLATLHLLSQEKVLTHSQENPIIKGANPAVP
jgi:hypothetical protein